MQMFTTMFILWSASFFISVQRITAQAQVSGNAIDLANMNRNMMNTKCPLEPCQSICLVEQPETGCFICNPKCNSGTNIGMPNSGMPIHMQPISSGQAGFYTGCEHDNWMQCSMSCTRKFDQNGCFHCQCQTTTKIQATTTQTSINTVVTEIPDGVPVSDGTPVPSIKTTMTTSTSTSERTKPATTTPTSVVTTRSTPEKSTTNFVSKETATSKSPYSSTNTFDHLKPQTPENSRQTKNPLNLEKERNITKTLTENEKDSHNTNPDETDNFKLNNLTFILFGIMIVLGTFCFVFFIAWKKSSRKLKRNKNELYFVHKAYRQDSMAHLSQNEMMDPVYADINPRPEPPPRSPPSLRSNIDSTGPVRNLSQSSETPLKEHCEEFKHDYLELI